MKRDQNIQPLGWSPDGAARRIGVGRTTVYELIKSGKLKCSKVRGRTIVHDESCQRLLEENLVNKGDSV